MLLSRDDADLFFRLHRSLMHFVNQQLSVVPDVAGPVEFAALPPEVRLDVRKACLDDVDLIELFVDENPAHLSEDELDIVLSWRHQVSGTFCVFRQLKNYMVFQRVGLFGRSRQAGSLPHVRNTMTLKLGKGSAFVKTRLRRLPESDDVWEADFLPEADHWMGLVVEQEHGAVLAMRMLEAAPSVNDLAHLLSDAMYRPLYDRWHRPQTTSSNPSNSPSGHFRQRIKMTGSG